MSPRGSQRRTPRASAARAYGATRWGRSFVDVVEGAHTGDADHRRITQARRYFRDHHAERLQIGVARVTASVRGSQLDPFEVTLTMRAVDPATVVALLRTNDATGELMALTRGEQPSAIGELIMPTESADIAADCTCPDESPRCIHVLCVAYEVAAEIDRSAATLLTVMGTDTVQLLAAASEATAPADDSPAADRDTAVVPAVDFYGTNATLPPLPTPGRMNPIMDLDADALRKALRASGIAPGDIGEAIDLLDDLYDRIRDRPIS
ncbi:hypothetical protein ACIGKQ_02100 [Gordonia sp. NPDC062954]|uniref:SWIM-type domain-containing protein n=1 Tax=Gordonia aquimaris TaxID=2984863 RepID=A0A9X3D6U0_9ACTN|nr:MULTISPECIES: hypothetical protein [Gordonia]MAU84136.1 hypothetical protein [Gordonia sp. (in: high G+C Gram-positive bacteria)]MCX2964717.1 hypothetical protein [Gordonia aquimaris]